jgi:hypothetical protein
MMRISPIPMGEFPKLIDLSIIEVSDGIPI